MPCKKDRRRIKPTGQAKRGSQRKIQILVNSRQEEFSKRMLSLLSLSPQVEAEGQWVSPLAEDGFNEYQDAEFLEELELSQHSPKLKDFWPPGGPCWDALGIVRRAIHGSCQRLTGTGWTQSVHPGSDPR